MTGNTELGHQALIETAMNRASTDANLAGAPPPIPTPFGAKSRPVR